MSADNWAICPRCKRNAEKAAEQRLTEAQAAYGKAPAEEYAALLTAARAPVVHEETFREDYELGVNVHGDFYVSYSGVCRTCGLSFHFEHSKRVPNVGG